MNFDLVRNGSQVPFGVALAADVTPTETGYTVARMLCTFPWGTLATGLDGPVKSLSQEIWKLRLDWSRDKDFCIRSWDSCSVCEGTFVLNNVTLEPYGDAWPKKDAQ